MKPSATQVHERIPIWQMWQETANENAASIPRY